MDSLQDLKAKYWFHSQKQIERAKKSTRTSSLTEIAQKSSVKLLALQKALKTKMDEKKQEKYQKRLLMYKIANEEEEANYEKFFDENESECEVNTKEEEQIDEEDESESVDESTNSQEDSDNNKSSSQNDQSENELNDEESMDCTMQTPSNLIDENRDLVTKMILKSQQSQAMNEEDLLGLCSAKVTSNDFIDDECEDDEDNRFDNEDESDNNESNDEESDEEEEEQDDTMVENKNSNQEEQEESEKSETKEETNIRRPKELESDSDDDLDFVNQFKFKKVCKIVESDDEEESFGFKNKPTQQTQEEDNNSNDIYDDLNSQDSQQLNNRESTFLESRSDLGKPRFNLKEFIEDQAELSEEDRERVSSDEEEDSNDEYEHDVIDENLPSEDEIVKANNKIFLKQQMDEDRREILEYQERFLEYGDLHEDGDARQRKFKWKNVDNVWIDNVKESSDSDEFDIDDSQIEYTTLHLKQLSEMDKSKVIENSQEGTSQSATQSSQSLSKDEKRKKKLMNTSLNKTHLSSYSTFDNSIFNKHMRTFKRTMVDGPANDIQSYIIKDKNLVNAMSVKSTLANQPTRSKAVRNDYGSNPKKRKFVADKNETNKNSIFDLFSDI